MLIVWLGVRHLNGVWYFETPWLLAVCFIYCLRQMGVDLFYLFPLSDRGFVSNFGMLIF
jgi:hypothetical protein